MQTATTESTKVIPAALFDELKKRADAAGGVGYGTCGGAEQPSCLGDIAARIDGKPSLSQAYDIFYGGVYGARTPSVLALEKALGESFGTRQDNAVVEINARKGLYVVTQRVTFDELVAELGLVRGEA